MAAAKSKTSSANGASKKAKPAAVSVSNGDGANGTASPVPPTPVEAPFEFATYGPGKPDKASYEKEQEQIKAQIDALQTKVVRVSVGVAQL